MQLLHQLDRRFFPPDQILNAQVLGPGQEIVQGEEESLWRGEEQR